MPTPKLTRAQLRKTKEAVEKHLRAGAAPHGVKLSRFDEGSVLKAAHDLGVDRRTMWSRVKPGGPCDQAGLGVDWSLAQPHGWPLPDGVPDEGFVISRRGFRLDKNGAVTGQSVETKRAPGEAFAVPEGHVIKGESALLDPDGRIVAKWVKTREGHDPVDVAALLKTAFEGLVSHHKPVAAPRADEDLLTLVPLADWHIGMYAWGREAGANWDLDLAERVIGAAVDEVIARSPPSAHVVVLGGGDMLHADNQENRTSRSGNQLDVDGRYPRVVQVAGRMCVRTVERALARGKRVTVRLLRGNHDEHSSTALVYFLLAWFREEPRVSVDVDPSLFWWMRHGDVLLGATHGHTVKIAQMPSIMAHRRAGDWGATRHRYIHGFHLHHKSMLATEGNGCVSEIHQAPIPQDAWHFGSGFLSGRSLQTITYHKRFGEVSRARVAILDADQEGQAA